MRYKLKSLLFEHEIEHDLKEKTSYSEPEIYDGDGDLLKRWYRERNIIEDQLSINEVFLFGLKF